MNNFISLAIGQLEEELKEIRKQADAAELNLDTIKSVRKNIVDRVTELSQEYTRRASAIDKYNLEVEKIVKYGKRAMELARNPLPMQLSHVPAIKKSVKGVKEIHAIVNDTAVEIDLINIACGVYFLLKQDEIVYIGQSVDCFSRVLSHMKDTSKDFNRACYFPVCREELDDIEETLIALFKPKQNRRGINNHSDDSLAILNTHPLLS
jgi:hypothetical protein